MAKSQKGKKSKCKKPKSKSKTWCLIGKWQKSKSTRRGEWGKLAGGVKWPPPPVRYLAKENGVTQVSNQKCVQNNRHCWRGSLLAHYIRFRIQSSDLKITNRPNNPHSLGQITSLVGQFGRSADLCNKSKFEYKHLSNHFQFKSQEVKGMPHLPALRGCKNVSSVLRYIVL